MGTATPEAPEETLETENTGNHNAKSKNVSKIVQVNETNIGKVKKHTIHQEQKHPSMQTSAFGEVEEN